jgi:membrane-associated protease RseP (regulator of RpoE activity)
MRLVAALRLTRWLLVAVVLAVALFVAGRHHPAYVLGVVIFIVGLVLSVILHELGHFLAAKKFGMKATQFFIGFGPTLWSTTRGETEYGVKAFPLVAFVRITGMTTMDEVDPADEPRAMRNKPRWQRAIVMVAGSFMHFAFAFVLLLFLAWGIGQQAPSNSTTVGSVSSCTPVSQKALEDQSCAGAKRASPARMAGLKAGDKIIAIDGKPARNWTQLGRAIRAQPSGKPVPVTVLRDGKRLTLNLSLAAVPHYKGSYMGIDETVVFQTYSPVGGVTFAGSTFGEYLTGSAKAAGQLPGEVSHLFSSHNNNQQGVSSVVGVAQVAGEVTEYGGGWQYTAWDLLAIIASVNIFLGAFNLLPLLPMDGGHLAMLGYEEVRGRLAQLRGRPDPGVANLQPLIPVSATVIVLLIGLSLVLMAANLFNPIHLIQ